MIGTNDERARERELEIVSKKLDGQEPIAAGYNSL